VDPHITGRADITSFPIQQTRDIAMSNEITSDPTTSEPIERTNCEVLVAPATVFGVGVPLSLVIDNIRSRAQVEGGPFRIPDNKLSPQYISVATVNAAIEHVFKNYPEANRALTCLATMLAPQAALSITDLEWARQEIAANEDTT
jgi:hypothetical protein